jgi:hypothetical protein
MSLLRVFCNGHLRLVPLILISGNLLHPRRSRLPSIKNYSGAAVADAEEREREREREGEGDREGERERENNKKRKE